MTRLRLYVFMLMGFMLASSCTPVPSTLPVAQNPKAPRDHKAFIRSADTWIKKGQYDRAIADFNEAAALAPNDYFPYFGRAFAKSKKKDFNGCITDCLKADRLKPNDHNTQVILSGCYTLKGEQRLKKGELVDALSDLNKAIEINPGHAHAFTLRADIHMIKGRHKEAISDYQRALAIAPDLKDTAERLSKAQKAAAGLGRVSNAREAKTVSERPAGPQQLKTPRGIVVSERRVALVIGNSAYEDVPLRNPVNDANDMARALEACKFKVENRTNVSRKQLREAIRRFGNQIKGGGVGLFFYAGHGLQVDGENYLVPIGAGVEAEDEAEDECIKVSAVLRKMETAGNRLNIIILDACRNNPFARRFRSTNRGLARMDAPRGSLLVYATAPGSVAADGTGRNGLFTANLLNNIHTSGVPIEAMLKTVRVGVMKASGEKQVPWSSSSLTGDFYFIPGSPRVTPGNLQAASAAPVNDPKERWSAWQVEMEAEFYRAEKYSISKTFSASDKAGFWSDYLDRFPENNPYSDWDETLRKKAKERQDHWKRNAQMKQVASVPPAVSSAGGTAGISGNWNSTYGVITFTHNGTFVQGRYPLGTVQGTFQGNTLSGKYNEYGNVGKFRFVFSSDWRSFTGGWSMGGSGWMTWNGSRQ